MAAVVAAPCLASVTTPAAASTAGECATVALKATPTINTAMIPETLKSTVTSCATTTETVLLVQHLSGPFGAAPQVTDKTYTITLTPGQSVVKKRQIPYACCGTYYVTDKVTTTSGTLLAKARKSFTFA